MRGYGELAMKAIHGGPGCGLRLGRRSGGVVGMAVDMLLFLCIFTSLAYHARIKEAYSVSTHHEHLRSPCLLLPET